MNNCIQNTFTDLNYVSKIYIRNSVKGFVNRGKFRFSLLKHDHYTVNLCKSIPAIS